MHQASGPALAFAASVASIAKAWGPLALSQTSSAGRQRAAGFPNDRPTWLALAHKKLDAAILTAYTWDSSMSDGLLLECLLTLNLQRAATDRESQ